MSVSEERIQRGLDVIQGYMGQNGEHAVKQMQELNGDFATLIIELFGDFYSREILDNKQKVLVTLSSLIALGAWDQLTLHALNAKHQGYTVTQIYEVAIQSIPYVGIPQATNALKALKNILE